jgi:hypothetical protein
MLRMSATGLSLLIVSVAAPIAAATPIDITVTVTNLQQDEGAFLTPFFLATHSGAYDFFNNGMPASANVEALAEDGMTGPRIDAALASGQVASALATPDGPLAPGDSRSVTFTVDPDDLLTQALSFASMVIPSNDAFIANDAPLALQLFDDDGDLIFREGASEFRVYGNNVWDAGTEINDEIPENTAFLAQAAPNTGLIEGSVIHPHQGFQGSAGFGGELGAILEAFPNADFSIQGTPVASISIVPEPATLALLGLGLLSSIRRERRV